MASFKKLTDSDVSNIRSLLAEGLKQKCIANKFDVSRSTISEIKRGLTHKKQRVMAIRQQLAAGIKQRYLAALYRVSQPTICHIGKGEIWN